MGLLIPDRLLESSTEDLDDTTVLPGIVSGTTSVPVPLGQPTPPSDGFVAGTQCAFKLSKEEKTMKIWLFGVLRDTNNYRKIISLLYSLPNDFTVHIFIHSPGGSIMVGCNILTAMERCKATVITYNIGMAASCGSLILAFGDKIHVDDNAITMFHHAGIGSQDSAHRLLTQTKHTIATVMNFFERMKERGVIVEEEIEGIVKRGEEYFITSDVMIGRLKANDIWYSGE